MFFVTPSPLPPFKKGRAKFWVLNSNRKENQPKGLYIDRKGFICLCRIHMLKAYNKNTRRRRIQRKGKMTKPKLNCLITQSIRTSCKDGEDAKSNYYRISSDKRYLRCFNLWRILRAKRCDNFAGFDNKRASESVCSGGGDCDW